MADRHSHNSRLSARVTYVFPSFVQPSKIFPYYGCFENHLWLPFHQDPVAPFLFLLFYHLLQEVGRNIFDSHCLVVSVTFDPRMCTVFPEKNSSLEYFFSFNNCCSIYYRKVKLLQQLYENFQIFYLQKRIDVITIMCWNMVGRLIDAKSVALLEIAIRMWFKTFELLGWL